MQEKEGKIPGFLVKLLDMINENKWIQWNEDGKSFKVTNQQKFQQEILPLYFKHSNFTSFIRQLNMYGFHKTLSLKGNECEFQNEHFQKNHLELSKLTRKKHASEDMGVKDILLELEQIKQQQLNINSQLLEIKTESRMIYGNSLQLQQQYFKQKDTIDKIVQFLGKVYGKQEIENISSSNTSFGSNLPPFNSHLDKKTRLLEGLPLENVFEELPHKSSNNSFEQPFEQPLQPVVQPSPNAIVQSSSNSELDNLFTDNDTKVFEKANIISNDIDVLGDRLFDIQNNLKQELDFDEFFNS
jgi:hypothetical protein